jgi:hypothetical protein
MNHSLLDLSRRLCRLERGLDPFADRDEDDRQAALDQLLHALERRDRSLSAAERAAREAARRAAVARLGSEAASDAAWLAEVRADLDALVGEQDRYRGNR